MKKMANTSIESTALYPITQLDEVINRNGQQNSVKVALNTGYVELIFGNMYECLLKNIPCDHRIPFGFNQFCGWLLRDDGTDRINNLLPCNHMKKVEPE